MFKWIGQMLGITAALLVVALVLPAASLWLVRAPNGAVVLFFLGPFACAVWCLFLSQIISSRCWLGAAQVRQWRASRGGYGHTVPAAIGWTFGSLILSFLVEGAVVFLFRQVWLLPFATFAPVLLTVIWCSRAQ